MYSSRQGVALLEQILVAVAGSEGLGRLAVMVAIVEAVSFFQRRSRRCRTAEKVGHMMTFAALKDIPGTKTGKKTFLWILAVVPTTSIVLHVVD